MKLDDLFVRMCANGLEYQADGGAMPPGYNGPHRDPETPVRNTSHWLISFAKAWELSGDEKFKSAALSCLAYLNGHDARPQKGAFWHRKNPGKDFSNGIIGQAWTLEALIFAYQYFQDETALKLAEMVFNLHPYDQTLQAWKIVNLDGTPSKVDRTFNHQLWFAMMGCMLMDLGISSVRDTTMNFVNNIHNNIGLYPNGVIRHNPYGYAQKKSLRKIAGKRFHNIKQRIGSGWKAYSHSVGYHAFNTYALHVIRASCPEAPVFKNALFRKTLEVYDNEMFRDHLELAPFGFPYNPPGIEIAVSLQSAGYMNADLVAKGQEYWLNRQFAINFDVNSYRMIRNTPDPLTYEARIYELTRLDHFDLDIQIK